MECRKANEPGTGAGYAGGMERLKAWLTERGVVIVYPGIASRGMITLLLRTPTGREIEVVLDPDDLEEDPEDTIEFVETILDHQPD